MTAKADLEHDHNEEAIEPPAVELRGVDGTDLPLLNFAYASRDWTGPYQWFGIFPAAESIAEAGPAGRNGGRLMIVAAGETAGTVVWVRKEWGPLETSWCWEVGIQVFPSFRRVGVGTRAIAILADYLFSVTPTNRVQAATDIGNLHAQQLLQASGFTREGLIRGAQWRDGEWHDQVLFARIRTDTTKD